MGGCRTFECDALFVLGVEVGMLGKYVECFECRLGRFMRLGGFLN
jgi:hypothetical protein